MAPIVSKIEIARPPNEVFSYVTDPSLFVEWQKGIVSGCMEGGAPPGVGSRCATTRRIGGAERTVTSEITQIRLPKSWAVHGVNAPIRAIVNNTVAPSSAAAVGRRRTHLPRRSGRPAGRAAMDSPRKNRWRSSASAAAVA